jgi:hypothetical protein
MLPIDAPVPLALFMTLLPTLSWHGHAASGHFAREHRVRGLLLLSLAAGEAAC